MFKYFFLSVFVCSSVFAQQSRTEQVKEQLSKNFEVAKAKSKKLYNETKLKSKQAVKWAKNNPKKAALLGAFGITCLTGYVNLRNKKVPFKQSVLRSLFNGLYLLHQNRLGSYPPFVFSKNFIKKLDGYIKRSFSPVYVGKSC